MVRMPKIKKCDVVECAYNAAGTCHTFGITVGGPEPACDTFYMKNIRCAQTDIEGGVGACKVEDCQHNRCLECIATGIDVKWRMDSPFCDTYKKR